MVGMSDAGNYQPTGGQASWGSCEAPMAIGEYDEDCEVLCSCCGYHGTEGDREHPMADSGHRAAW